MKTLFTLAVVLTVTSVLAQSDIIIRQRAKELSNQNNVRQGVAPPTQPAKPAQPTAAAPVAPAKSPAMSRLEAELAGIKANAAVTPELKNKIAGSITAMAQGTKPSLAAVTKLAEDLATACSVKPLSPGKCTRLAQEIDAVLNPSKYPQAKPQAILDDIQAIFQENGLDRKQAVAIADDVKAIGSEVQKPATK